MWLTAALETFLLVSMSVAIATVVGTLTAITAWASNLRWASYIPLLLLAVPPWLFSIQMGEVFGHINPWIGASISLGLCSAAYVHSMVSASLMNKSYGLLEAAKVLHGNSVKAYWVAVSPSLRTGIVPGAAFVAAEALTDYGVSNYYGINTLMLTTFNVWSSTWDFMELIPGLIMMAFFGVTLSGLTQGDTRTEASQSTNHNLLIGLASIAPTLAVVGFSVILSLSWVIYYPQDIEHFVSDLSDSTQLVVLVSVAIAMVMSLYILGARLILEKLGILMYMIPGVVVGALVLFALGGIFPLLIILVVALTLRHFGLVVHAAASSLDGNAELFEAADVYLSGFSARMYKAAYAMPAIIMGYWLVVLDVLREVPVSMLLQPTDFSTIAMRMNYTDSLEGVTGLGLHSLTLLAFGLVSCVFLIGASNDSN
jgi:iron(III) transport system permease protein